MTDTELSTIEIDPTGAVKASIIWMHGLGANAHDFEPVVPHLGIPPEAGLRFVFPNAPKRAVTVNNGFVMPAWYDILGMELDRREDDAGIRDSERAIQTLIRRENARGIASEHIFLAGFSQGGAMALHTGLRYPEPLAGILALSCYLPLAKLLEGERHPANQQIPIFMAHGSADPVVPLATAEASVAVLKTLGYAPDWREYPMQHEVNMAEIQDIGGWLRQTLAA